MVKNKNKRKPVTLKKHQKKARRNISRYKGNNPSTDVKTGDDCYICCVCSEEHGLGDLHDIQIKNETKTICKGCVDIIHGLI